MNKTYLLTASASYTAGTILVVADSVDEIRQKVERYLDAKYSALKSYVNSTKNKYGVHEWTIEWEEREKIEKEVDAKFPVISEIDTGIYEFYLDQIPTKFRVAQTMAELVGEDGWFVVVEFYSDLPKGFHYVVDYCA